MSLLNMSLLDTYRYLLLVHRHNDYRKKPKSFYKCQYDLAYVLSVWVKIAGVESEWILKVLRQTASNKCGCHHTRLLGNLVVTEHLIF